METVDIVFDGPPGPKAGRFVEVEDQDGRSISLGEWVEREDGYHVLRIPKPPIRSKTVHVVMNNQDLTEGRGSVRPGAICDSPTTARRLAKGKGVQGSDSQVQKATAVVMSRSIWLAPAHIEPATQDDRDKDHHRTLREEAIQRVRDAGVSWADIERIKAT